MIIFKYKDKNLQIEERVKDLLSHMTIEEKMAQTNTAMRKLQMENDRLARELDEVSSAEISSAEQVQQLRADLHRAKEEIDALRAEQAPAESRQGSPE